MWPEYNMFFRKQCWHLVSACWSELWVWCMNALKYHWCMCNQLIPFQAVLKHVVSPKISSLCKGPVLYSAKNEEIYGIVSGHATLLLKRKLQHVGHKWVICGSHLDCSVGQWVKWVNRCNPLSTLMHTILYYMCLNTCISNT